MQEDIVIMERSLGKDRGTCTFCGIVYPARVLLLRVGDPGDGVRSEHALVCPECERLLYRGEAPGYPLDASGRVEHGAMRHGAAFESIAEDWWSRLDDSGRDEERAWDEELTLRPTYGSE